MVDIPDRMPVQTASNAMLNAIEVIKKARAYAKGYGIHMDPKLDDSLDELLKSKICMDLLEHRYGRPTVPEVLTPEQLEDRLVDVLQFYTRNYSYDRHRMFLDTLRNRCTMLKHELDEDNKERPEITESNQDNHEYDDLPF